jgi:signal peptide peptidase SppA
MGADHGLDEVMAMTKAAVADPDVKSVVFDVDSPGGLVDGVPEAAVQIRRLRDASGKPFVSVANGQMASAAYWLGSQAHEVVVAPSAVVGSVGVYQRHEDLSEMAAQEGVKITLISAGEHKTEGNPFEPLGDEARQAMQSDVNYFYSMFVADVAEGRQEAVDSSSIRDGSAFGGGRSFPAKPAVKIGLADREATLSETVSRLSSGRAKVRRYTAADDNDNGEGPVEVTLEDRERFRYVLTALNAND